MGRSIRNPSLWSNRIGSGAFCLHRIQQLSREPAAGSAVGINKIPARDREGTFEYVIETFTKVFGYPHEKSLALALQIHTAGRGVVWSGALEVAELKRDQLRSAGPDFYAAKKVSIAPWA